MTKQTKEVVETLKKALEEVKWNLPDGPEKSRAYQCVQEAILWLHTSEVFKDTN